MLIVYVKRKMVHLSELGLKPRPVIWAQVGLLIVFNLNQSKPTYKTHIQWETTYLI